MSTEKGTAIVLRVVDFSETSNVVTLLTREWGKIHALAKGGRRPKGPFESALDLLALCRVVFLRKSSEALDLLTEAKLERRFRGRDRDLSSLYAGYYVAELLNELTDDYDPHPSLFDAAEATLLALSTTETPIAALILRFELTALRLLGHFPSLRNCVECGDRVEPADRLSFGIQAGGVLCRRCRPGQKQVVSVSEQTVRLLEYYAAQSAEWQPVEIDRRVAGELRGLLNHYLYNLLGRKPRMHSYLGVLAG